MLKAKMSKDATRIALLSGWCGVVSLLLAVTFAVAQTSDQSNAKVASLRDQLEKGLKARRKIEFQFVGHVVQLVDQGRLDRKLVLGTFTFVTKKYRDRKYLVPIFEQALRKRAAAEGNSALNDVPTTLTIAG